MLSPKSTIRGCSRVDAWAGAAARLLLLGGAVDSAATAAIVILSADGGARRALGLWEILGQNGEIQEKIHELTLFYYIMHDEPSRALSSEICMYFALSTSCICLYFGGAMSKIQTQYFPQPYLVCGRGTGE